MNGITNTNGNSRILTIRNKQNVSWDWKDDPLYEGQSLVLVIRPIFSFGISETLFRIYLDQTQKQHALKSLMYFLNWLLCVFYDTSKSSYYKQRLYNSDQWPQGKISDPL